MKSRIMSVLLVVILVLSLFPVTTSAAGLSGSGTSGDPYLIKTKSDLDLVRNDLDAYYRLENDLTFTSADFASGGAFYNGGKGWQPIATEWSFPFTGVFDGNGKKIVNLQINATSSGYFGLFGIVAGTVKNLGMSGGNITVDCYATYSGYKVYAGVVAGALSSGTMSSCYNTGSISLYGDSTLSGSSSVVAAGGIAGETYNSTVTKCYNKGSIYAQINRDESVGDVQAGGISGYAQGGTISYCYNTGSIRSNVLDQGARAESYAGGITGYLGQGCSIKNSNNAGTVKAENSSGQGHAAFAGGIAGGGYNAGIRDSFNLAEVKANAICGAYSGGLVGYNSGLYIYKSYNSGTLSASSNKTSYVGGIIGKNSGTGGEISNCYFLNNVGAAIGNASGGATKLTGSQMKVQSSFTGFDFSSIWTMAGNADYPYPELTGVKTIYEPVVGKPVVSAKSAGYNSIRLSWGAVTGASGYMIYRATSAGRTYTAIKNITSGATLTYTNGSLTTNTTYYYKILAYKLVEAQRVYGAASTIVSAKPLPAVPGSFKAASAGSNSIKLSWSAVAGASGYMIYRATSSGGTYTAIKNITSGTTLTYTNSSLTTNTTYYYKIFAYKMVGSSRIYGAASTIVSAKPLPAVPGSFKAASAGSNSIKLSWSAVAGASGYMIYRATSSGGTYTAIKNITSGATLTYTNSGLKAKTTYYYKIRAYRTVGGNRIYGNYSGIVFLKT